MASRCSLAEDSLVNQEIARDCLESVGCIVTAVNEGREALFTFAKGKFDIVLMDCQMPGMDGFEATRMIRDLETTTGRIRTPIVALTANALRQDRDVCLAVGMNDYLSKPFIEADLILMVEKWLPGRVSLRPKDDGKIPDVELEVAAVAEAVDLEAAADAEMAAVAEAAAVTGAAAAEPALATA